MVPPGSSAENLRRCGRVDKPNRGLKSGQLTLPRAAVADWSQFITAPCILPQSCGLPQIGDVVAVRQHRLFARAVME